MAAVNGMPTDEPLKTDPSHSNLGKRKRSLSDDADFPKEAHNINRPKNDLQEALEGFLQVARR